LIIHHCVPWESAIWMILQTAEITEEKRRASDSVCKLPGVIHSNLIPWYTTGFE